MSSRLSAVSDTLVYHRITPIDDSIGLSKCALQLLYPEASFRAGVEGGGGLRTPKDCEV